MPTIFTVVHMATNSKKIYLSFSFKFLNVVIASPHKAPWGNEVQSFYSNPKTHVPFSGSKSTGNKKLQD